MRRSCRNRCYTAGVKIRFTTSRVNGLPSLSCTVSWNTTESPVILITYPLNTGSFSRRKYALFRLLVTTAINPLSDFTTPRRLMLPISRHFFPVEHPEPFCCTTGEKNGSRFPFIAHFLSACLGLALSPILLTSLSADFAAGADALASLAADCFSDCFGAAAVLTSADLAAGF